VQGRWHELARRRCGPQKRSFISGRHQVNVVSNCPKCGAPLVPGAKFCPSCGTSLAPARPQPFILSELLIGDIPVAFGWDFGFGPVRIVFTDQRILVLWTGPHQFFPSMRVYKEWKASLPDTPRARVLSGPWVPPAEPPAWEIDNSEIVSARVGEVRAIPSDSGMCALIISAVTDGIRSTTMGGIQFRRGLEQALTWRVPGPAPPIEDFLRRMPVAQFLR